MKNESSVNGWISVDIDFPMSHTDVIVFNPNQKIKTVYVDYFRNISKHEHRWNKRDGVTHWMPLPEPPKTTP